MDCGAKAILRGQYQLKQLIWLFCSDYVSPECSFWPKLSMAEQTDLVLPLIKKIRKP